MSAKHTTIAEELRSGNSVAYFTLGASMRPLLRERETHVVIAPIEDVRQGDILLYVLKSGVYVLHRLIRQDESHYYTRGDNTYALETIGKAQAIGWVTHIYRNGKIFDTRKNRAYRAYVALWTGVYPLRWLLWKAKGMLWRALR